jgi:hypothetical protein
VKIDLVILASDSGSASSLKQSTYGKSTTVTTAVSSAREKKQFVYPSSKKSPSNSMKSNKENKPSFNKPKIEIVQ